MSDKLVVKNLFNHLSLCLVVWLMPLPTWVPYQHLTTLYAFYARCNTSMPCVGLLTPYAHIALPLDNDCVPTRVRSLLWAGYTAFWAFCSWALLASSADLYHRGGITIWYWHISASGRDICMPCSTRCYGYGCRCRRGSNYVSRAWCSSDYISSRRCYDGVSPVVVYNTIS